MDEPIDVANVLCAVNNAFETGMIGCLDSESAEKRMAVADLRQLVKRAINQSLVRDINRPSENSQNERFNRGW